MTIVPRTGPLSASSALAITSWYQRGKSSARGVSTRAMTAHPRWTIRKAGARDPALALLTGSVRTSFVRNDVRTLPVRRSTHRGWGQLLVGDLRQRNDSDWLAVNVRCSEPQHGPAERPQSVHSSKVPLEDASLAV